MKLQLKVAMAALMLGMCSTVTMAEDSVSSESMTGGMPHERGDHGCGHDCKGKIDIELKVEKHCDLDIKDDLITLKKTGKDWTGGTHFKVRTNAPYNLDIDAPDKLRNGYKTIPVVVETKAENNHYLTGKHALEYKPGSRVFQVDATVAGDDVDSAYAGLYTGTYKVAVEF
ncbi:hypothetical protein [Acinetobacter sp. ANC 4173]|uniref:hypothetical protein n=1 Tax=Acinetobacter sp. ANC 4173 TaxID=2529837 RepID=UPI001039A4BB|nr:hypothetical protein [Acinetobacter sp. ANC 4173]TCB78887.1 hypothetical protein E0H94_12010 [Acinetobacter sp. ANC 4173]